MRAVRHAVYGGPEVLDLVTVGDPQPRAGEALVRVGRCGVNPIDRTTIAGRFGDSLRLPHIPGCEIAGTVEALGPGTAGPEPATAVAVSFRLVCGECRFCLAADETACTRVLPDTPPLQLVGVATDGGWAELVVVPAANLVPAPAGIGWDQAACAALDGATAHHLLERARLRPGERVLVVGASGGVGAFTVMLSGAMDAEVWAVTAGAAKADAVRALGAHRVIDRLEAPFGELARELTGGDGMDIVADPLGAATFDQSLTALGPRGRYVTCGMLTGSRLDLDLGRFYTSQQELIGSTNANRRDLVAVLDLMAGGRLRCPVHGVYPLDRAADALRALDDPARIGKVLVSPGGGLA